MDISQSSDNVAFNLHKMRQTATDAQRQLAQQDPNSSSSKIKPPLSNSRFLLDANPAPLPRPAPEAKPAPSKVQSRASAYPRDLSFVLDKDINILSPAERYPLDLSAQQAAQQRTDAPNLEARPYRNGTITQRRFTKPIRLSDFSPSRTCGSDLTPLERSGAASPNAAPSTAKHGPAKHARDKREQPPQAQEHGEEYVLRLKEEINTLQAVIKAQKQF